MNNNKRHKPNDTPDTPDGVNGGVINRQLTFQTRKKIDDAASRNDRRLAFTTYDESKNNPAIALPMHTLNVLLHLCSANDENDSFSTKEEDKERAEEIFFRLMKDSEEEEDKHQQGRRKTEMSYTAMARVYARNGEFEKSFEMVDLCKNGGALGKGKDGGGKKTQQKLTPKLRTYAPSLRGFCESGNWKRAEDVFEAIEREGLECTEMEFTAMMSVYGREKKTCEENGFRMLRKMKSKVRTCGKELIESVERFFKAEPNAWRCETVENVESSSGRFEVSSENTIIGSSSDNNNNNNNNNNNSNNSEKKQTFNLKRVGLNEVESKELIASVGKLAREREAGANFDDFCNWLEAREAKVQCIVDGANVGMANQNFAGSRFHFGQLDNVVEECRRRYCVCSTSDASEASKQRPVVFLHQRRTKDHAAKHQFGEKILNKLRQNKEIFVTPHGSNDDWYWLYAALVAGEDAVLISNDEMRDHVFQMLPDPNLLRRWKERHQVRFSVTKGEVELYEPAVFTTCIQENEEEEYWMIPFVEDDDEEKENDDDDDDDEKWLFCCKKQ